MSDPVIEGWTLYAVGVAATFLRFYARMRVDGFRSLKAEDYLMVLSIIFYTIQTTLAYNIGILAHGLANNGMSEAERASISPSDPEYDLRVIGSKIQVAGWTIYSALIWSLKLSMLYFYTRLTNGLGRQYRIRIYIGFALVIGTFVATMIAIFAGCRHFSKYWQISPDPGNACQAAISKPIVWASFASNPKNYKKIASSIVLGSGIFVLVCATLKSVFVLVDPVHGAQLAGVWGTREAFVAVMTTNLPILFPLFRVWLTPVFGSILRSSHKTSYQYPTGFQTIGGGGRSGKSSDPSRRGPPTANPISVNMSFNSSEERIVKIEAHGMANLNQERNKGVQKGIMVSNMVEIVLEDKKDGGSRGTSDSERSW
ncbi:hypothetical protein NXS19_006463 [Fusarium pseudograminearum]|nr:hypothetical protein NXS19_006463 [Fusarium pseudograminearum]